EVVLEAGRDVDDGAPGEDHRRGVRDIRWLVEDDLVARVAGRPQGEVDRLGRADRDQQLGGGIVGHSVPAFQVRRERPAQLDRAVVARVMGPPRVERSDAGGDDPLGRVEVGLPHPEADDVVHRCEDVEEAPDPGRWHGPDAFRQRALGERPAGGRRRFGERWTRGGAGVDGHVGKTTRSWGGRRIACGRVAGRYTVARYTRCGILPTKGGRRRTKSGTGRRNGTSGSRSGRDPRNDASISGKITSPYGSRSSVTASRSCSSMARTRAAPAGRPSPAAWTGSARSSWIGRGRGSADRSCRRSIAGASAGSPIPSSSTSSMPSNSNG